MIDPVVVFDAELHAWLSATTGPVARFLYATTEAEVIPEAQDALSVPAIRFSGYRVGTFKSVHTLTQTRTKGFAPESHVRETWAPNPPPGPPRLRSGDLKQSIHASFPTTDEKGLVVYGVALASHRGWSYPRLLLEKQYKFLPIDDRRFIYADLVIA